MAINELWPNVGKAGGLVVYVLTSRKMAYRNARAKIKNPFDILPTSVIYGVVACLVLPIYRIGLLLAIFRIMGFLAIKLLSL